MLAKIKDFFSDAYTVRILLLGAAFVVVIQFTFNWILMLDLIPSGSMENTVMTGDILIGTRYDREEISRYDIVVFIPPEDPESLYLKRVIGLPGETILVEDGKVYADGVELDDSFIAEEMDTSGDGTFVVPEGCYFMMGDNRNHSWDARFWDDKYVPLENIEAKARLRIFPFTTFGDITYEPEE
jgi:signal peptidase I